MLQQIISAAFMEGSFLSFCILAPMTAAMIIIAIACVVHDVIMRFLRR